MRRRNKARVVWLPQTDANSIGANTEINQTVYQLQSLAITGATGTTGTVEIPLVLDAQVSFFDAGASLADIESSGYRLRRIVGKIWVQCGQTAPTVGTRTPLSAIVTAGIMVRTCDTVTGGSLASVGGTPQLNPGLIENTGDPWIWRRSWVLGNNYAFDNVDGTSGGPQPLNIINPVPPNNYSQLAGGIADGPHVDQKTARIVGPEHRLFLDVSATILGESGSPLAETALDIAFFTDLRVLGSLRQSVGNRRNASR